MRPSRPDRLTNCRDWLTGLGAIAVLAVAFLIATPTGRALQLAVRGVPPGTPQAEAEALIDGDCDDGVRLFCLINVNITGCDAESSRRMFEDASARMEAGTSARTQYRGPLFAVEFDSVGKTTSRFVGSRVFPQLRVMGVVNALGVVLIGVGIGMSARLSRRAAMRRRGAPLPAPLP